MAAIFVLNKPVKVTPMCSANVVFLDDEGVWLGRMSEPETHEGSEILHCYRVLLITDIEGNQIPPPPGWEGQGVMI